MDVSCLSAGQQHQPLLQDVLCGIDIPIMSAAALGACPLPERQILSLRVLVAAAAAQLAAGVESSHLYGFISISSCIQCAVTKIFTTIREETVALEIFVHYPDTPEKQEQLDARVAQFHAEYVAQYIDHLKCPMEQKLKLIDAIAQTAQNNSA